MSSGVMPASRIARSRPTRIAPRLPPLERTNAAVIATPPAVALRERSLEVLLLTERESEARAWRSVTWRTVHTPRRRAELYRRGMAGDEYNYADFAEHVASGALSGFEEFADRLHAGSRAPSFPLTRLDDGTEVELRDLWRRDPAIVEFGSFT